MSKARRPVTVQEGTAPAAAQADGLWCIGLLRVALELKRPSCSGLEQATEKVATKMGLPRREFERFARAQLAR